MKATELRIGNITQQGEVIEIRQVNVRVKYTSDKERTALIRFEDLYPIPLTKEKLLDIGFDVKYDENKKPRYTHKYLPDMELLYGDIGITNYMLFAHRWNITRNNGLKYIHELQNLYYALTKQELTKK